MQLQFLLLLLIVASSWDRATPYPQTPYPQTRPRHEAFLENINNFETRTMNSIHFMEKILTLAQEVGNCGDEGTVGFGITTATANEDKDKNNDVQLTPKEVEYLKALDDLNAELLKTRDQIREVKLKFIM